MVLMFHQTFEANTQVARKYFAFHSNYIPGRWLPNTIIRRLRGSSRIESRFRLILNISNEVLDRLKINTEYHSYLGMVVELVPVGSLEDKRTSSEGSPDETRKLY